MSVVPGQRNHYRKPQDHRAIEQPADDVGPVVGVAERVAALDQSERCANVGHAPLQDLVILDALPD